MSAPTPDQPGWFPDADDGTQERWFDGERWTDLRRRADGSLAGSADGPDAGVVPSERLTVAGGRGLRAGVLTAGAVLGLIVLAVGIVTAMGNREASDARPEVTPSAPATVPAAPAEAPSTSLDLPTIEPGDFPTGFPTLPASPPPARTSAPAPLPSVFDQVPEQMPTDASGFASMLDGTLQQMPGADR